MSRWQSIKNFFNPAMEFVPIEKIYYQEDIKARIYRRMQQKDCGALVKTGLDGDKLELVSPEDKELIWELDIGIRESRVFKDYCPISGRIVYEESGPEHYHLLGEIPEKVNRQGEVIYKGEWQWRRKWNR